MVKRFITNFSIYLHSTVEAPVLSAGTTTATTIPLSWTSAGSEAVSYEVMWETDDIGGCSGGSDMNNTTITDGSTSYDIMGLEEDSSYTITVTASNSAGSSAVSNLITAMTLEAGERWCVSLVGSAQNLRQNLHKSSIYTHYDIIKTHMTMTQCIITQMNHIRQIHHKR